MNYIKQLQQDKKLLEEKVKRAEEGLDSIRNYCLLPKFHTNEYVNIGDILLRVREVKNNILDAESDGV